jgi:hypothetical protein
VNVNLCASTDFDVARLSGVIREYVHPQIENLRVDWIRSAPEPSLGLGVIEVPTQDHERKYFLTARVVEEGQSIRQIVFGLSTRNKSANDPLSIQELQEMIQKGKSSLSEKLLRMEEKIDALIARSSPPTSRTPSSDLIDQRIQQLSKER